MNDMAAIKQKFLREQEKAPNLGDCIIFARALKGTKIPRRTIFSAFNRLVSKSDYLQSEREKILNWMIKPAT
jgi:hypothetical protein